MPPFRSRERDTHHGPVDARHVYRHSDGERDAALGGAGGCHEIHVDRRIAAVARRQQNLVSIEQLRAVGVTQGEWERRVRSGHLHPKHRGVFSVGSPLLPPLGRERAALLAVPGAVLAKGTAGAVLGMMPPHPSGPVELLTTTNRRSRPGITVHRTNHLPAEDVRTYRGVLLTSPVRVVLDLTSHLGATALERLVAEVLVREPRAREELRQRGTARLRRILDAGPARTRSAPERRLLTIIRRAGLPQPETNARIAGHEVDALWREHRLVVEVDTFATHGDRVAFERDRRKQADLARHGLTTVRVTDRRLDDEPLAVAATLAQALAAGAASFGAEPLRSRC